MSDRGERQSLLLPIVIPIGALAAIVLVLFTFSRVLLSLKANAATATALAAAAGIMTVAAFVASRRSVTGAALGAFVGASAGIAMLAGGIAIAVIGPPEEEEPPILAAVAAPEGAITEGFSTDALAFQPDREVELEFTNEDTTAHNIWILDGPDDTAPPLFQGDDVPGSGDAVYRIPPLEPGEYFFFCELHPDTAMQGTVTVSEGAGGVEVVAQNLAFDTEELRLPAETPTTLTLDNKDTAPHNVSIYEDDTASGEPLFTFEPFSGPDVQPFPVDPIPEGEYYFRCDVHTNMEGTVVVEPGPPPEEGGEAPPGEGSPSAPPEGGG
ncbi:MAG TPA: cupredoxin domain-containing protein [Actinomycetota bacterium]|nr:cupredoxin domain-containing protein [Actinomycetota bacterium]